MKESNQQLPARRSITSAAHLPLLLLPLLVAPPGAPMGTTWQLATHVSGTATPTAKARADPDTPSSDGGEGEEEDAASAVVAVVVEFAALVACEAVCCSVSCRSCPSCCCFAPDPDGDTQAEPKVRCS